MLCAPVPFIVGVLSVYLPKVLKLDLEEVNFPKMLQEQFRVQSRSEDVAVG